MEAMRKSNIANRKLRRGNPKKDVDVLNNIVKEYCLKRNQFHPEQPSPNMFCNRLELRMKAYYDTLKSSFKL